MILCQSVARRKSALQRTLLLRHESHVSAATTVQARFRIFLGLKRFIKVRQQTILLQAVIRRWIGVSCFLKTKQNAVFVQSRIRKWIAGKCYKRMVSGNGFMSEHALLRAFDHSHYFFQDMVVSDSFDTRTSCMHAATTIASQWRSFRWQAAYGQFREGEMYIHIPMGILCNTLDSSLILMIFNIIDTSICQSAVRRYLAVRKLEELRCRHKNELATVIQSKFRSTVARRNFVAKVYNVVKIQSIVRRFSAEKYLGRLIRGKPNAKLQAV